MNEQELKQFTVYVSGYTYYLRRKGCRALQPATFRARNGPCSDSCYGSWWHLELDWPDLAGMKVVGTFDTHEAACKCIEKYFRANGNPSFPSRVG